MYSYKNNSYKNFENKTIKKDLINKKILDINDLITKITDEKITQYNSEELDYLKSLMQKLSDIEYDIINVRYSVDSKTSGSQITLQDLGNKYNLTRERIRQIEKDAIDKLAILYRHNISINSEIPFNLLKNKTCKFLIQHKFETIEDLVKSSRQALNHDLKIDKKSLKDIEHMLNLFGFMLSDRNQDMINFDKLSARLKKCFNRKQFKDS